MVNPAEIRVKRAFATLLIKAPAFLSLTKPRLTLLVMCSTLTGFYLATSGAVDVGLLIFTLLSIGLTSAGALALNQFIERNFDAQMDRTRHRPLPGGKILPREALGFGVLLCFSGLMLAIISINPLTGFLILITILNYVLIYTPLKRLSPVNTAIGAISGALPIVCGWTAVRNSLDVDCLILFGILFFWQFPHFLSIALLYQNDYSRAGYKMFPVVDNGRLWTDLHIIGASLLLLITSILPAVTGLNGTLYLVAAIIAGSVFLGLGIARAIANSAVFSRRLMLASFVYPIVLWGFMIADKLLR